MDDDKISILRELLTDSITTDQFTTKEDKILEELEKEKMIFKCWVISQKGREYLEKMGKSV